MMRLDLHCVQNMDWSSWSVLSTRPATHVTLSLHMVHSLHNTSCSAHSLLVVEDWLQSTTSEHTHTHLYLSICVYFTASSLAS